MSLISPPSSSTGRAVVAALIVAALLGLAFLSLDGTRQWLAKAQPYEQNAAIDLAGEQVPPELDSFYLFIADTALADAPQAQELAQKLRQAAAEHDYLGLIGPDPRQNRRILLQALRQVRGQRLDGLILIYLGPTEFGTELTQHLSPTGAELRYVVYPGRPTAERKADAPV